MIDDIDRHLNSLRRYTSALRSNERGWDWELVDTPDGPRLEARQISIEESESEMASIVTQMQEYRRGRPF